MLDQRSCEIAWNRFYVFLLLLLFPFFFLRSKKIVNKNIAPKRTTCWKKFVDSRFTTRSLPLYSHLLFFNTRTTYDQNLKFRIRDVKKVEKHYDTMENEKSFKSVKRTLFHIYEISNKNHKLVVSIILIVLVLIYPYLFRFSFPLMQIRPIICTIIITPIFVIVKRIHWRSRIHVLFLNWKIYSGGQKNV